SDDARRKRPGFSPTLPRAVEAYSRTDSLVRTARNAPSNTNESQALMKPSPAVILSCYDGGGGSSTARAHVPTDETAGDFQPDEGEKRSADGPRGGRDFWREKWPVYPRVNCMSGRGEGEEKILGIFSC